MVVTLRVMVITLTVMVITLTVMVITRRVTVITLTVMVITRRVTVIPFTSWIDNGEPAQIHLAPPRENALQWSRTLRVSFAMVCELHLHGGMRTHKAAQGLRRFAADTRGASMVEYALLLFLVLCIGAIAYRKVGKDVRMAGDMTQEQFISH